MNTVFITEKIKIGGNNPCFIIAEIGQNHQGDIEIAKKLIKAAKEAGADCVKFQKSCLEEKFTKPCLERPYNNSNSWGTTYGEHKKFLEFSEDQYRELLTYAKDIDIIFTASAMDMESFNFLLSLKVPFIKLGSGDSNNMPYIEHAASKKIPLIISTGMVDKSTVDSIYNIVSAHHKQFCLLHCVSAYPTPYEDCNLLVLQDYTNSYEVPIGYSGHEFGINVALAAVALGAKVIEKHITLDRGMKGTDHKCSLLPPESEQLVKKVRSLEVLLGSPSKATNLLDVKMVEVKITEDIKVGGNNPCFIIAEVGQNHQGDIEIAKKLIKAAKDSGASCVKFQKTCLKEKFTKKYLERTYDNPNSWGKTYGEHKRHLEFTETQYRELFKYAQEIGILFTASAMDMVSFDFLVNIKVPFIKISSGDSNNSLFLKYAASKKVPLIISTGMVDKKAVKTIYDIISSEHKQFCLLHCISAYPVPYEDCNLTVLQDYMKSFDVPVGYSGQELGTAVALGAVALGAKVLEKHITLDKSMKGTDHVCSLTPSEFQQLVRDVRVIEAALGTPIKKVVTSEIPCIDKLQKSLVMGSTKNRGEILYPGDVKIKVAEPKGLNALHFEDVIYKTLVYDKKEDEPLNEGDFC